MSHDRRMDTDDAFLEAARITLARVIRSRFPPDAERDRWLDWLAPWTSYRTEIEELIDLGERVVVVVRDYAKSETDGPEVDFMGATIWTTRDGRVARVDFYAGGRAEGLASAGLKG